MGDSEWQCSHLAGFDFGEDTFDKGCVCQVTQLHSAVVFIIVYSLFAYIPFEYTGDSTRRDSRPARLSNAVN